MFPSQKLRILCRRCARGAARAVRAGRRAVPFGLVVLSALAALAALAAPVAPAAPAAPLPPPPGVPDSLVTRFERSGGTETPRYDEAVAWCRSLDAASPRVVYTTFGESPQGRPLPLVIVDRDGLATPDAARAAGRAVVWVQACIHAGEPDGKDAGLLLLRDLAVTRRLDRLLEGVTLVFLPIFNVDGHERFGPYNRINQDGPREMGWRTTAAGLNLNRDHLKADTPEMRAWLRLFTAWLPDLLVDCHVTDGADYQYVLTYALETCGNRAAGLRGGARDEFLAPLPRALAARDLEMAPYVMFRSWHDPRSGLSAGAAPPRFMTGYAALQNRPALLLETHMLKDYRTRVAATRAVLEEVLGVVSRDRVRLRRLAALADSAAAAPAFRATPFPLEFHATSDSTLIDFRGVAFDVVTSDLTGGPWIRYDRSRPLVWRVPYFDDVRPTVRVPLPAAYVIPPEWEELTQRLLLHGVTVRRLARDTALPVAAQRLRDAKWREKPYEGRHTLTCAVEEFAETRLFPAGSAVIDLGQRTARVIAHALEPAGPDAFVRWGFCDAIFEQKEYAEAYVMEVKAREMLAADPALRTEFAAAQAADPEFAKGQDAMLNWFFQRTPWWDQRIGVHPVGRIMNGADVPR